MSVTILLEDDVDVSRGDMICRPHNRPRETREVEAMVCWMSDAPLQPSGRYPIKHTTRTARAMVDARPLPIDVNTLHRDEAADELAAQRDRARAPAHRPRRCSLDQYRRNRATGSFILIDEATNDTVGAGMVL